MDQHRIAAPDLERVFRGEAISGLSEWQLLARYLEHRDELAFEALVARHGPMVLGTCRRMLSADSDVDDAFQATFLVLVRRASALGPRDAIGPWLHGVAARVSMRARSQAARRRRIETIAPEHAARAAPASDPDGELASLLDQEVNRLPAKYRSPIILCYLEGQTHEEAARQLKWPLGTVKGRLARARDLLRARLLRRGVAPSLALVGLSVVRGARAAVEQEVLDRTVRVCMKLSLGQTWLDGVSVSTASLVKGALTSMILDKLKWAGLVLLAAGMAFTGAAVMARQEAKRPAGEKARTFVAAIIDGGAETPGVVRDQSPPGEKAPATETAKSEIEELRDRLIQAARREWATALEDLRSNRASLDQAYQASKRLMAAEAGGKGPIALAAAAGHAERMRDVARIQDANPSGTESQRAQVKAHAAEAELLAALALARAAAPPKSGSAPAPAGPQRREQTGISRDAETGPPGPSERGKDPRSRQVLAKLEDLVAMKFPDETPLSQIIKHIKESTRSSDLPGGIPIYVHKIGLQEAEKTLDSVVSIDLEGIPLRRTLQLALAQLDLAYFVEDGILYITSQESADQGLPPAIPKAHPLFDKIDKAERGELTPLEMKELIEILKYQNEIESLQASRKTVWGGEGPDPQLAADQAKSNKEMVESLVKLTQSLLAEMKELRKAKQPAAATTPAAKPKAPAGNLQ
jgi:RNA polymerase sigma factor (sigma-70 family)